LDGPLRVFASIENQGYIAALYYGKMNNDIFLETANMIEPSNVHDWSLDCPLQSFVYLDVNPGWQPLQDKVQQWILLVKCFRTSSTNDLSSSEIWPENRAGWPSR
jgi:hypothetical protein